MDLIARQGEVGTEGSRRLRRSQNAGYAGAPAKPGVIPGDPILPSKAGTADRATGVTAGRSASETAESKSVATPPLLISIPAKPVRGHYPIICHVKRKGT